jgi:hypothetical protein
MDPNRLWRALVIGAVLGDLTGCQIHVQVDVSTDAIGTSDPDGATVEHTHPLGRDASPSDVGGPPDATEGDDAAEVGPDGGVADTGPGADSSMVSPPDSGIAGPDSGPGADASVSGAWSLTMIDRLDFVDTTEFDVAIGPDGVAQVVYLTPGVGAAAQNNSPTLARFVGAAWDQEIVDEAGTHGASFGLGAGPGFSLAVDASGQTLLVYTSTFSVVFATRQSRSNWSFTDLGGMALPSPFGGPPPGWNSLAIARGGDPVVAFNSELDLVVSRRIGGSWSTLGKFVGSNPVVLPDSEGISNVLFSALYSDGTSGRSFVGLSTAGWSVKDCGDSCAPAGRAVLDPQNRLHYMSGGDHLSWAGTMKTTRTIESTQTVAEYDIAVDASGGIHLAYRTESNSAAQPKVRYAFDDGTTIRVEDVATSGDPGWGLRIAVGPDGSPVIVYYDASSGDLMSAFRN